MIPLSILFPLALLLIPAQSARRCATVSLAPVTPVIEHGQSTAFFAAVGNCGEKPVRFYSETVLATACGEEIQLGDNYSRLSPGQGYVDPQPWAVSADACTGRYQVTTTVYVGNTYLAHDSAEFEVR